MYTILYLPTMYLSRLLKQPVKWIGDNSYTTKVFTKYPYSLNNDKEYSKNVIKDGMVWSTRRSRRNQVIVVSRLLYWMTTCTARVTWKRWLINANHLSMDGGAVEIVWGKSIKQDVFSRWVQGLKHWWALFRYFKTFLILKASSLVKTNR